MGDLYAESTKMLEEYPEEGEAGIQELFEKWESNDAEIIELWKSTRQWSLDGFNEIYKLLDIHFDRIYYESDMEKAGKEIVRTLIEKNIAIDEREQGEPVIVKIDELLGLEKETYRVLIILRSDGTALYATWDLALAQQKFSDYDLAKSIYVVDVRQSLHFKQVFKTLELSGFKDIEKAYHLPYEIVNLPGNVVMKSREGTVVLLEDLIREATKRAYEVGKERNPKLDEQTRNEVASQVALGAIKYPMLARDNTKVATFDWESALDFNGHAAPYIQYAFVRANSLLKKFEQRLPESTLPTHQLHPKEIQLIELISQWPQIIQRAADEYKTLPVSNLAYEMARAFNEFYNACPVIKAEPTTRATRLRLVNASQFAIGSALQTLGISAPQVM
ncbi:MAG: arginine--tRNA ligase, partial [Chloroflexota bacterium]